MDTDEPRHVGEAVRRLAVSHAVVTSVNRDEMPDGGAGHFAQTISWIRKLNPACTIEVLIPDFLGNQDALNTVVDAKPDILNHNTETVPRLYKRVRPDARYDQSMELLRRAHLRKSERLFLTKSGVMAGLGETVDELIETFRDIRATGCDILTVGQYMSPTPKHIPIEKYYSPEEFGTLEREAVAMGFRFVEAGPLVRSSYHAGRHVEKIQHGGQDEANLEASKPYPSPSRNLVHLQMEKRGA